MAPKTRAKRAEVAAAAAKGSAAAGKVFDVAELLELILLNTSHIDIFVLQRVSRTFAATIAGSPKLQHKLYSRSVRTTPTLGHVYHHIGVAFHRHFQQLVPKPAGVYFSGRDTSQFPLILNISFVGNYAKRDGDTTGWQGRTVIHPHGFWRKMTLGAAHLGVTRFRIYYTINGGGSLTVELDGTMGDLVDAFNVLEWRRGA